MIEVLNKLRQSNGIEDYMLHASACKLFEFECCLTCADDYDDGGNGEKKQKENCRQT